MPAHPNPVQKVVLVDMRDNTRWQLSFDDLGAEVAVLRGPDARPLTFTRSQVGSSCDFTTRDDSCTLTMPTPGIVRTFGCSVNELQPFLHWIRADLAPFERARVGRELLFAIPLGLLWILAGSPITGQGVSRWLIGYGAALVLLGVVGRLRPNRYLLVVDALLWFGIALQNARVAYGGSGVLAVLMTLFAASYGLRVLRAFVFHRALAQK